MGILSKALSALGLKSSNVIEWTDGRGAAHVGDAGELVTATSALGLSAVWACANLTSGTISSLPLQVFQTGADGYRSAAREHPLYRVLHDSPNFDQTALDFLDYMGLSLELWGNAYARVERRNGQVVALYPVRPDVMAVRRLANGSIEYRWSLDRETFTLLDRDVLHIRGPGGDPLGGMSTLAFARNNLSAAQAADRAASAMFKNGLRSPGAFKFKEWLSPEQRETAVKMIDQYTGAMNAGKPIRLEGGMDYQPLSITPEDAQMLETRQFGIEEICRFFGVPPALIGHAGASTAWPTSVEQQQIMFVQFTLRRRLARIEQAMNKQLLSPEDRAAGYIVQFNIEGLLRGDSAARASFYGSGLQSGWLTINEVRRRENLPAVAGGDTPRMQMQNVPITQAGEADGDV
ncbi:portal-like protein [Paracoccus phage Shpa]|uniref:Portal-like protein n=1 Tax=Paracoccus phage Shpa TaxID=1647282 RepID=A0A0U2BXP2_9CAUD|nr:portal protein [Paracoccus phage Shpa]AKG94515.1 portal-like protein [Paracoccus phage Shpa]